MCRIALPHICLYVLLCLYLLAGAWAFACIEHNAERAEQAKKLERIGQSAHADERRANVARGAATIVGRSGAAPVESDVVRTTTGYGPTTPLTPLGQWLSIGYGLLGMHSAYRTRRGGHRSLSVRRGAHFVRQIPENCQKCVGILRGSLSDWQSDFACGDEGTAVAEPTAAEKANMSKTNGGGAYKSQQIPVALAISKKKGRQKHRDEDGRGREGNDGGVDKMQKEKGKTEPKGKRRLPLSVNAAILLLFCMLGGVVYIAAAGSDHNFIEGFFVTFNLVANLTMSEMPTDISRLMTLIYIFVFVTFDHPDRVLMKNHTLLFFVFAVACAGAGADVVANVIQQIKKGSEPCRGKHCTTTTTSSTTTTPPTTTTTRPPQQQDDAVWSTGEYIVMGTALVIWGAVITTFGIWAYRQPDVGYRSSSDGNAFAQQKKGGEAVERMEDGRRDEVVVTIDDDDDGVEEDKIGGNRSSNDGNAFAQQKKGGEAVERMDKGRRDQVAVTIDDDDDGAEEDSPSKSGGAIGDSPTALEHCPASPELEQMDETTDSIQREEIPTETMETDGGNEEEEDLDIYGCQNVSAPSAAGGGGGMASAEVCSSAAQSLLDSPVSSSSTAKQKSDAEGVDDLSKVPAFLRKGGALKASLLQRISSPGGSGATTSAAGMSCKASTSTGKATTSKRAFIESQRAQSTNGCQCGTDCKCGAKQASNCANEKCLCEPCECGADCTCGQETTSKNGSDAIAICPQIGIIGGTGLKDPHIMERSGEVRVETPYGRPSDALIEGNVAGVPCVLLSRHGRRHQQSPTNINYRANIWALKKAGVSAIVAACACGSLREELEPGKLVLIDSFIDRWDGKTIIANTPSIITCRGMDKKSLERKSFPPREFFPFPVRRGQC
ncbi:hypothetical protein niasHS_011758 [Heterodera schachtii]|uniref:Nucleoside phosphorylase domain-containing protein n=1 Tax=Heterodera schachtii TaxID=97005 RepID=A0ABD2IBZ1_HETSC